MAKRDFSVTQSHAIEEAVAGHTQKLKSRKRARQK
jgi:hypothetical protein